MLKMIGKKYLQFYSHNFCLANDHIMPNCTLQGQIYIFVSLAPLVVTSGVLCIDSDFVFESFDYKASTVYLLNDPQEFFYPFKSGAGG